MMMAFRGDCLKLCLHLQPSERQSPGSQDGGLSRRRKGFITTGDGKQFLCKKLPSVKGLYAVVRTDRDGAPVLQVARDSAPERAFRPGFLTPFALAVRRREKTWTFKKIKLTICYYNTYKVVQYYRLYLGVSFIASSKANQYRTNYQTRKDTCSIILKN